MPARQNPIVNCPITAAWAAIGGKWKLTIVYWLARKPLHFAGLRRQLNDVSEGISQKVLAQQLRELIADGIVARAITGEVPSPVIYSLTQYGCSALPMLDQVKRWGETHIARSESHGALSCSARIASAIVTAPPPSS
jgi:DNA-binding HxlR family transcriptional regulator